ncbi:hypothetical protein G2W53_004493 [Senna tora]|uniref:Uncharacterized protein n=1 Tax=Senna tora TaxID=362788 RepID=A0A834XD04_9FABA|nr:hypothetical protein G2W53_004493 [Senna tora]
MMHRMFGNANRCQIITFDLHRAVYLNSKNVQVNTFNASGIRSYYNLPRVEEYRYEELKGDDQNFPWNEIEEELSACWDPHEGSKRYILRGHMNAIARIWLILVSSNIKTSKYLSKISRKTTLLLYLLMTNQPVELEAIIYKSLCKVAYNGRAGCALIFSHMISDFYFNAGVPADDIDDKFKPKQPLDYKRVGKDRVDPDDPCTSEAQAHPIAEASSQPFIPVDASIRVILDSEYPPTTYWIFAFSFIPVEVELKLADVSAQTDLTALLLSVSATPMVPNTTGRRLLGLAMKKSGADSSVLFQALDTMMKNKSLLLVILLIDELDV